MTTPDPTTRVYQIHRDGAVWRVQAESLVRACERADPDWARHIGAAKCRRERENEQVPLIRADDEIVTLIPATAWLAEPCVRAIVRHVGDDADLRIYQGYAVHDLASPLALRYVVGVVLGAADRLDASRKAPLYTLPSGVTLYRSGKRKGQLRFPKGTTPEQREAAERFHVGNVEREAAIEEAQTHLDFALAVLVGREVEPPDPKTIAECDTIVGWFDMIEPVVPWDSADVKAWIAEVRRVLAGVRDSLLSQDEHGYRVGERCYVEPDPDDRETLKPIGRCEVVGARIEHWRYGGEDNTTHFRTVIDAAGREWDVPLVRLHKDPRP